MANYLESNYGEPENSRLRGRGPVDRSGPRVFDGQRSNHYYYNDSGPRYTASNGGGGGGGANNAGGGGGGGGGGGSSWQAGWNRNGGGSGYNERKRAVPNYPKRQTQTPRRFDGTTNGSVKGNAKAVAERSNQQVEQGVEVASMDAAQSSANTDDSDSHDRTCPVCQNETKFFGVFVCDHAICFACATKLSALCETRACPICRADSPTIFLVRQRARYLELHQRALRLRNERYHLVFEDGEVQAEYLHLLEYRCSICTTRAQSNTSPEATGQTAQPAADGAKPVAEPSRPQGPVVFDRWEQLKAHMRSAHSLYYCEICEAGLKLFSAERKTYTRAELAQHKRSGDANAGYRGHPLCEFCEKHYLDTDELLRHLRKDHFFCHFCDVEGSNEYYCEYPMLLEHFRAAHFVCEEDECANIQFTNVFRTELDLKAHRVGSHTAGLSKAAQKAVRQVDIVFGAQRNHFQRRTRDTDDGAASSSSQPDASSATNYRDGRGARKTNNRPPRTAPTATLRSEEAASETPSLDTQAASESTATSVPPPAPVAAPAPVTAPAPAPTVAPTPATNVAAPIVQKRIVPHDEDMFPRLAIVPAGQPPVSASSRLIVGAWAGRGNPNAEHEWPSLGGGARTTNDEVSTTRRKRNNSLTARTGVWTVGLPRTGSNANSEAPVQKELSGWNVRVRVDATAGTSGTKRNEKAPKAQSRGSGTENRGAQQLAEATTDTDSDDLSNNFVRLGRDGTYEKLIKEPPGLSASATTNTRTNMKKADTSKQAPTDESEDFRNFLLPFTIVCDSNDASKRASNSKRNKHTTKTNAPTLVATSKVADVQPSSATPPPGLAGAPRSVAPPPGFDWFDMKPVSNDAAEPHRSSNTMLSTFQIPSSMLTLRVDDKYTYETSLRLKDALESGTRQLSKDQGPEQLFMKPPDCAQRNRSLIEAIRRAVTRDDAGADSANSKYDRFKLQSNKFRARQISATEYLLHCAQLFDTATNTKQPQHVPSVWQSSAADSDASGSVEKRCELAELLPELIALLPDVSRQHELLLAALSSGVLRRPEYKTPLSEGVDLRVAVCEQCGQICVPRDSVYHASEHAKQAGALEG